MIIVQCSLYVPSQMVIYLEVQYSEEQQDMLTRIRYRQLPIPQNIRTSTNIPCTIVSTIFALVLFVWALVLFISNQGKTLSYFSIPTNIINPSNGNIDYYDYYNFVITIACASICSLGLGLLWLSLVQLAPKWAPRVAAILAMLGLLTVGIFCFFVRTTVLVYNIWLRYLFSGIAFALVVIILIYLVFYSQELTFQGLLLRSASSYLSLHSHNYLMIPLFLFLTILTAALFMFQHIAFSLSQTSNNNLFDFFNPGVLGYLNVIQLLWAFRFLQDSFSFIIGGNAVYWYFHQQSESWSNLIFHHWGSVSFGSFFNFILQIPFLFLQFFICNPTTYCRSCCHNNSSLRTLISYPRSDIYTMLNLAGGIQYHCRPLCEQYGPMRGPQSPLTHYRILATLCTTVLGFIVSFSIVNYRVVFFNAWFLIVLLLVVYQISGYFVWISSSVAEGFQVSVMAEQERMRSYENGSVSQGTGEMAEVVRELEGVAGWSSSRGSNSLE